ncbi:hypothetical protein BRADI_3g37820v3 [Brachypodium distachyon]|uniref:Cytochrome P450 n=1 Tax=Brachypodium distachyon TaxID=15368 RepID=I1I7Q0_BRADI|nr:hypothetical protein BRADI_3g37820v3 [Brachypodium distachyon]
MEIELWPLWATVLTVVSLLYYCLTNLQAARGRRATGTERRLPPGPTPLPILGNVLSLGGNLHHTLARLARAHGPVMTLKLGLTTAVVVSSRDAAREAFTRHDRRLAARAVPDTSRALGFSGRSIIWLPSSDPLWRTLRGIVAAHVFSARGLAAARGARERKVRDMVRHFRCRAGREVSFGQAVYGGVLNLMSSAFCSVDVVSSADLNSSLGLRELVEDLIEAVAKPNVSDLVPFLRSLDLQGWRRWTARRFEKIFRILDAIIDRRMAADNDKFPHGDFMDSLLELVSEGKIGRDNLTTILFDVLAAGSDTTTLSVEWAMAELLRNAGAMARARAEIRDALGGKESIEEADVASLRYLQAVVKESLRLHPVRRSCCRTWRQTKAWRSAATPCRKGRRSSSTRGRSCGTRRRGRGPTSSCRRGSWTWTWRIGWISGGSPSNSSRSGPGEGCAPACRWRSGSCRLSWRRCCTRSSGGCRTACRPTSWI